MHKGRKSKAGQRKGLKAQVSEVLHDTHLALEQKLDELTKICLENRNQSLLVEILSEENFFADYLSMLLRSFPLVTRRLLWNLSYPKDSVLLLFKQIESRLPLLSSTLDMSLDKEIVLATLVILENLTVVNSNCVAVFDVLVNQVHKLDWVFDLVNDENTDASLVSEGIGLLQNLSSSESNQADLWKIAQLAPNRLSFLFRFLASPELSLACLGIVQNLAYCRDNQQELFAYLREVKQLETICFRLKTVVNTPQEEVEAELCFLILHYLAETNAESVLLFMRDTPFRQHGCTVVSDAVVFWGTKQPLVLKHQGIYMAALHLLISVVTCGHSAPPGLVHFASLCFPRILAQLQAYSFRNIDELDMLLTALLVVVRAVHLPAKELHLALAMFLECLPIVAVSPICIIALALLHVTDVLPAHFRYVLNQSRRWNTVDSLPSHTFALHVQCLCVLAQQPELRKDVPLSLVHIQKLVELARQAGDAEALKWASVLLKSISEEEKVIVVSSMMKEGQMDDKTKEAEILPSSSSSSPSQSSQTNLMQLKNKKGKLMYFVDPATGESRFYL